MPWSDAPEVQAPAQGKWASAPEVSAEPAQQPGTLRKILSWMHAPMGGPGPIEERQQANAEARGPGFLKSDASGLAAGAGTFLSGLAGPEAPPLAAESQERLARYRQEHPAAAILLGLSGGLARPFPGVPPGAPSAARLSTALDETGNALGRRVLAGGATPLTVKAPVSAGAIDEAFRQGAFGPLGTTQKAADVLERARETVGSQYGQIVKELEARGINQLPTQPLAQRFAQEADAVGANTMNPAVTNVYRQAAEQLAQKGENLGLTQAENLKRSLQDQARSAYRQLQPNEVGQAHEAVASAMRQAVENTIEAQASKAPDIAAQFVPVKQQLGNIIEASDTATKGAAQAARRAGLSLTDYLAAGAGASHGPLGAGAGAILNKIMRTYGPSTATWALKSTANVLGKAPEVPDALMRVIAGGTPAAGKLDLDALLRLIQQKSSPATLADASQQ